MIQEAAEFAEKAHAGIYRKGGKIPYFCHLKETALLVAQMTEDETVIAAAYLHDVLEDTEVTGEEIEKQFGLRILNLVAEESENKSLTWRQRKEATLQHLSRADRTVKILALADKLSNMRSTAQDYMIIGDEIWKRFNDRERDHHRWYYHGLVEVLEDLREFPEYEEFVRLYEFVFGT